MNTYYKDQLSKITVNGEFPPSLKITDNNDMKSTKHMNLNPESAQVLIDWLAENFLPKPAAKSKPRLETVTLKRIKVAGPNQSVITTTMVYKDGELLTAYPKHLKQPTKGCKFIKVDGVVYRSIWE